ncbi:MAG TPA: hypothetical protein VF658_03900 [Pyrinomonadaceae bacterium]|jgi:NOL1/NOP2/fmu family ribosome biogenesis protein
MVILARGLKINSIDTRGENWLAAARNYFGRPAQNNLVAVKTKENERYYSGTELKETTIKSNGLERDCER